MNEEFDKKEMELKIERQISEKEKLSKKEDFEKYKILCKNINDENQKNL